MLEAGEVIPFLTNVCVGFYILALKSCFMKLGVTLEDHGELTLSPYSLLITNRANLVVCCSVQKSELKSCRFAGGCWRVCCYDREIQALVLVTGSVQSLDFLTKAIHRIKSTAFCSDQCKLLGSNFLLSTNNLVLLDFLSFSCLGP